MHVKRVFQKEGLDIAVLGCYLNLANPDPVKLAEMQERYYGSMRVAKICGAGMVGTETGTPNVEYKYDAATHGKEALQSFIRGLEPVVECAEHYGMTMAIEPVWKHIVWNPDRGAERLHQTRGADLTNGYQIFLQSEGFQALYHGRDPGRIPDHRSLQGGRGRRGVLPHRPHGHPGLHAGEGGSLHRQGDRYLGELRNEVLPGAP